MKHLNELQFVFRIKKDGDDNDDSDTEKEKNNMSDKNI